MHCHKGAGLYKITDTAATATQSHPSTTTGFVINDQCESQTGIEIYGFGFNSYRTLFCGRLQSVGVVVVIGHIFDCDLFGDRFGDLSMGYIALGTD